MVSQDIPNNQFSVGFPRCINYSPRIGDGRRQRLLDKHVGAGFHRRAGIGGVAVGIGGDHNQVGVCRQSLFEGPEEGIALQFLRQLHRRPVHQTDDLGLFQLVVCQGVAKPHVSQTGNQYAGHFTAPDVMPRISCREKIT